MPPTADSPPHRKNCKSDLQERECIPDVLETGLRDVRDNALFLRPPFFDRARRCGRLTRASSFLEGDERRSGRMPISPIEHRAKSDDSITVFENGGHGDGTARTFIEHVEALVNAWRMVSCHGV